MTQCSMGCIFRKRETDSEADARADKNANRAHVSIGSKVTRLPNKPVLIFIFGGPNSKKGMMIEKIVTWYGFKHIDIIDIITTELCRNMRNPTVRAVQKAANRFAQHITMTWLSAQLEKRVKQDTDAIYLIDIVPNSSSKFLLRARYLDEESCQEFRNFESKFPISFALSFASVMPRTSLFEHNKSNGRMGKAKPNAAEFSDEASVSSISKRASYYQKTTLYIIHHFYVGERLVSIDVSGQPLGRVWRRTHKLLLEEGFAPKRNFEVILLFEFDEQDHEEIDAERFFMETVRLREVVKKPRDSVQVLLKALHEYVNMRSSATNTFVVQLQGTTLADLKHWNRRTSKNSPHIDPVPTKPDSQTPSSKKNDSTMPKNNPNSTTPSKPSKNAKTAATTPVDASKPSRGKSAVKPSRGGAQRAVNPAGKDDKSATKPAGKVDKNKDAFAGYRGRTKRTITFVEPKGRGLEDALHGWVGEMEHSLRGAPTQRRRELSTKYRTIGSLENELFLFPLSASGDVCKMISDVISGLRTLQA